jgi:hypothetical protein
MIDDLWFWPQRRCYPFMAPVPLFQPQFGPCTGVSARTSDYFFNVCGSDRRATISASLRGPFVTALDLRAVRVSTESLNSAIELVGGPKRSPLSITQWDQEIIPKSDGRVRWTFTIPCSTGGGIRDDIIRTTNTGINCEEVLKQ